jgi:hypothetical protein
MSGALNKVKIHSFLDKRYNEKDLEFTLPINPEQYSQTFKVAYDLQQARGSQGTDPRFESTAPEELKLDFVFDGTGTVSGYELKDGNKPENREVTKQIEEFLKVVYDMSGQIHKPKFLKVVWGNFSFDAVLTNLQINYTLFKPDGSPLRAKLSATFTNYIEQVRRTREEGKSSPDLTHVRTVREGDHLPLMTHKIYHDAGFYLEVARVNGLTNFRKLRAHAELFFPPVAKPVT